MEGFLRPGVSLEDVNRPYGQPTPHLSRYSLRLDGFASLTAPVKRSPGRCVSRAPSWN